MQDQRQACSTHTRANVVCPEDQDTLACLPCQLMRMVPPANALLALNMSITLAPSPFWMHLFTWHVCT